MRLSKLLLVLGLALNFIPAVRADTVINFSNLGYPNGPFDPNEGFPPGQPPGTGSYDNGWDLNGGFSSGGAFFYNSYDTQFSSWSGWAYSDIDDPTKVLAPGDQDYNHQFAAITGTAPGGSGNYGLGFDGNADGSPDSFINLPTGTNPKSMLVTNSTYAYLSIVRRRSKITFSI